jgi:DNA-binding transcriptional LysR family regulator
MLDELRHFLLVADHGTFTEAARRAHLSQPALSASIHRLENQVGARLFHRGAGGTRLTPAGQALVPRARAALAAVDEGRRAVAEIAGLQAGEVRLAGGATACTYYLPPVLTAFRREHPNLVLKLRETTSAVAEEALEAGELDLAIITSPRAEPWIVDQLILVAAPGFDLSAGVARAPMITFPPGASTREALVRHFPDAPIVMELSGIAAVKAFVRARVGVALVSRAAVESELGRGALVEVRHKATPIARPIGLVHLGTARLAPAAAALRERLLAYGASRSTIQRSPSRR